MEFELVAKPNRQKGVKCTLQKKLCLSVEKLFVL